MKKLKKSRNSAKKTAAKKPSARAPAPGPAVACVILAAGEGRRMLSELPKVCHSLCGVPMIAYPVRLAKKLALSPVVIVVSGQPKKRLAVQSALRSFDWFYGAGEVDFAIQKKPLGTGDALRTALAQIPKNAQHLLVLYGDVPLIQEKTLREFLHAHDARGCAVSLVSMQLPVPRGYGRIVRNAYGNVEKIVEEKDATERERALTEVNTGTYAFRVDFLKDFLNRLTPDNQQEEYYLTDLVRLARQANEKILAFSAPEAAEFQGANTRVELAELEMLGRKLFAHNLLEQGVIVRDLATLYVEAGVAIEPGAILEAGVSLSGRTVIARNAKIGPHAVLRNTRVEEDAVVKPFCVLDDAVLEKILVRTLCAPASGRAFKNSAKVGNFVELKKTTMGVGAKASHLAYLGDASVGQNANIGAGTITCNYDGYEKFRTEIGAEVFVGSDTQIVAPVKIGKGAVVAAGTTVTADVPAQALVLSRVSQVIKKGWAKKRRLKNAKKKKASDARG